MKSRRLLFAVLVGVVALGFQAPTSFATSAVCPGSCNDDGNECHNIADGCNGCVQDGIICSGWPHCREDCFSSNPWADFAGDKFVYA
jgi:hypothetical protein